MIDRPEKAMVIIPHPDDAEGGCGGTVGKWIQEGTEVVFVLCTNGDKGTSDPEMTSEKLAAIREVEQADAANTLGVKDVIYLRYPDGGLEDTELFRSQVTKEIRRFKPDVILAVDPYRRISHTHRDHRKSGQVAIDAAFPYARDFLHYPEHISEGLETHKVGDVLMWGTEEADVFIDITDTIDLKINALKKHVSQVGGGDRDVAKFVKERASQVGKDLDMPYAEAFRRIKFRR